MDVKGSWRPRNSPVDCSSSARVKLCLALTERSENEPPTLKLRVSCSANWATHPYNECREIRTLDLRVKSPLLCHLSYTPMITVVGFEPTILSVVPSIHWMLASLVIQGLVLLRRTHPHFVRTLDYFVIESWYEEPALTNWATLQVQTVRLELTTVGLEIRCADPLRHACIW